MLTQESLEKEIPVMLSRHPSKYDGNKFVTRGVYVDRDLIERCAEKGISVARVFSTLGNRALEEYLNHIEGEK